MTGDQPTDESDKEVERQRWPIGFMLLIGVTALYLGWRFVQGFGALAGWMTG